MGRGTLGEVLDWSGIFKEVRDSSGRCGTGRGTLGEVQDVL